MFTPPLAKPDVLRGKPHALWLYTTSYGRLLGLAFVSSCIMQDLFDVHEKH